MDSIRFYNAWFVTNLIQNTQVTSHWSTPGRWITTFEKINVEERGDLLGFEKVFEDLPTPAISHSHREIWWGAAIDYSDSLLYNN